jgi:hypothetical protein
MHNFEFSRMPTIYEELAAPVEQEVSVPMSAGTLAVLQNFLAAYPNGFVIETSSQQASREQEMLDVRISTRVKFPFTHTFYYDQ